MVLCLLVFASSAQAAHSHIGVSCARAVTAKQAVDLAREIWAPARWPREHPKAAAIAAHHRQVRCAVGPGHRTAIRRQWLHSRAAFYRHRQHCLGGRVVRGRVSYFGGGLEASGHYTSEPGIALNITPGTTWGWNNAITRGWLAKLQRFWVTIAGHRAILPVTDLGPADFVHRAIDVTEGGVEELHLVGTFPTDAIGTAKLIPYGCV